MLIFLFFFDCLECFIFFLLIVYGFVYVSGLLEGDRYWFICEFGYLFIGDDILVCIDIGVWNGLFFICFIGKFKELVFIFVYKIYNV